MTNVDQTIIVDEERRCQLAQIAGYKPDPEQDANFFNVLADMTGKPRRKIALVSAHDYRCNEAFRKAGFFTIPVNGNRAAVVEDFVEEVSLEISTIPDASLFLVSNDQAFLKLCRRIEQKSGGKVTVLWNQDSTPAEFQKYDFHDLKENSAVSLRYDVRFDLDNLLIQLKKKGIKISIPKFFATILEQIEAKGEIIQITAYGDFDDSKSPCAGLQRTLVKMGIDTVYVISEHGKNSSDMRMAKEIQRQIEGGGNFSECINAYLLGSGDRDLYETLRTGHAHGKQMEVMSWRGALSQAQINLADNVWYLDDLFTDEKHNSSPKLPLPDQMAGLTLHLLLAQMRNNNHRTYYRSLLKIAAKDPEMMCLLKKAVREGIVKLQTCETRYGPDDIVTLNMDHFLVAILQRLVEWAPQFIKDTLASNGDWEYVSNKYLTIGMTLDSKLKSFGFHKKSCTRLQLTAWLELLAEEGLLIKETREDPQNHGKIFTTWRSGLPVEIGGN